MREWIRGEELLTPPWNITKDSLFQFVEQGMLVPYDPHNGPIFPTEYLADQYESWIGLAMTFDALERDLAESDEDWIAQRANQLELNREWRYSDIDDWDRFKARELEREKERIPECRQQYIKQIEEIRQHSVRPEILSPAKMWKDLNLSALEQLKLEKRLLDAVYRYKEVNAVVHVIDNKNLGSYEKEDYLDKLEKIRQERLLSAGVHEKVEESAPTARIGKSQCGSIVHGHRSSIELIANEIGTEAEFLYSGIRKDLRDGGSNITAKASQTDIYESLQKVLPELKLKHLASIEIPRDLCTLKKGNPKKNFIEKIIQLFAKIQGKKITLEEAASLYHGKK
jgi:hypothetical protein